jgi:hypothetical protein
MNFQMLLWQFQFRKFNFFPQSILFLIYYYVFFLFDFILLIIRGPSPVVGDVEGSCDFDAKKSILYWRIPLIDNKQKTGSMEFTVPEAKNSQFFPVSVSFVSSKTLCSLEVLTKKKRNKRNHVVFCVFETKIIGTWRCG